MKKNTFERDNGKHQLHVKNWEPYLINLLSGIVSKEEYREMVMDLEQFIWRILVSTFYNQLSPAQQDMLEISLEKRMNIIRRSRSKS